MRNKASESIEGSICYIRDSCSQGSDWRRKAGERRDEVGRSHMPAPQSPLLCLSYPLPRSLDTDWHFPSTLIDFHQHAVKKAESMKELTSFACQTSQLKTFVKICKLVKLYKQEIWRLFKTNQGISSKENQPQHHGNFLWECHNLPGDVGQNLESPSGISRLCRSEFEQVLIWWVCEPVRIQQSKADCTVGIIFFFNISSGTACSGN